MENKHYRSLENIYNNYCAKRFQDPTWLLEQANKYLSSSVGMKNKNDDENESENENENENENRQTEKRFEIYNEACQFIPSTVLVDRFTTANRLLSDSYNARKEFASQLGLNYAVQYLLSSSSAYANQIEICLKTGNVISSFVKPNYNSTDSSISFSTSFSTSVGEEVSLDSQSNPMCVVVEEGLAGNKNIPKGENKMEEKKKNFKENQYRRLHRNTDLPFRLTRNIMGSLSGHMLLGGTTVSFGLVLDSCLGNKDVLDGCLNILLNSDVRARRNYQEFLGEKERNEIKIEKKKGRESNKNENLVEKVEENDEDDEEEDKDTKSTHHSISYNIIDIKVRN